MRAYRAMLLVLVALLLAVPAGIAQAAEAKAPAMALQMWPEGEPGQMLVIVSAQLPEGQKAPATIDLPLMEGAQVLWVGEIVGDDPSKDIPVEQKIVDGEGGKMLRVPLTTGNVAQYEASVPGLTTEGDKVSATVKWVQATAAPKTSFAVRLPSGVGDVQIRPAAPQDPQTNAAGETLHTLPDRALKAGESVTVDIAYVKGGAVAAIDDGPTGFRDQLPIILGVVALALGGVAVWLHTQSRRQAQE